MHQECHICGKPASAQALVEGAKVFLCENCLHFGKRIEQPVQPRGATQVNLQAIHHPLAYSKPTVRPSDHATVEDFGDKIRNAREQLHLTRKELANTLFISENVIERLEDELLKPDIRTAEKLEKFLKIRLIEVEGSASANEEQKKALDEMHRQAKAGGTTFGDVVDLKIRKK